MSDRILVISFSDLTRDHRVRRQIELLKRDGYSVVAAGHGDPEIEGVTYFDVPPRRLSRAQKVLWAAGLKSGRYRSLYWSTQPVRALYDHLAAERYDCILVNDIDPLEVVLEGRGDTPILYDAHEYAPREYEGSFLWRFFWQGYKRDLCRRNLGKVDRMMTVSPGLANEYEKEFGVKSTVVASAPHYSKCEPKAVNPDEIRIVHHGGIAAEREIGVMAQIVQEAGHPYTLDLIVDHRQNGKEYAKLVAAVERLDRVRLLPPMDHAALMKHLNTYDIGLYRFPPISFNAWNALPNKFFEFIQARLALVIGPSPSMAELAREHEVGLVVPDFKPESFVEALRNLTPEAIERYRRASDRAAELLCFEREGEKILDLIDSLCHQRKVSS